MSSGTAGTEVCGEKIVSQSSTKIKVCGIQPGDDLSFTAAPTVAHIGVIYVNKSRRYVAPEESVGIVKASHCPVVGVFTDASVEDILSIRDVSGIEIAQLHGNETEIMCETLKREGMTVWKAVQVPGTREAIHHVKAAIARFQPVTDALLLDAKPPSDAVVTGGHGISFDWQILNALSADLNGHAWWVAGGLTPENVSSLFDCCHPYGIDVSSGVETNGRKDQRKIQSLIEAVVEA